MIPGFLTALLPFFVVAYFSLTLQTTAALVPVPCSRGSFGPPDCRGTCHCLGGNDHCHLEDGRCTDGQCSFGWTNPPLCQTACLSGFFGLNCTMVCRCPVGDICHRVSGLCSSNKCLAGWGGPSCQILLPVLSNPPIVTATTETQITLTWPKWVSGRTGLGQGVVTSYTLQQFDNTSNAWKDVVNLNDSSTLIWYNYSVEDLRPNTAYKFRIQLVLDDNRKSLPSYPGPESAGWIMTRCGVPSKPPTDLSAELIQSQKNYVRVTWTPPSLESTNCNGISRHEIFLDCARPCVSLMASEDWPVNVSVIEYFHYAYYIINITVRALNDAGLTGPLSVPFRLEASSNHDLEPDDIMTDNAEVSTEYLMSTTTDVSSAVSPFTTSSLATTTLGTTESSVSSSVSMTTDAIITVVSAVTTTDKALAFSTERPSSSSEGFTESSTGHVHSGSTLHSISEDVATTTESITVAVASETKVYGSTVSGISIERETSSVGSSWLTSTSAGVSLGIVIRGEETVILRLYPFPFNGYHLNGICKVTVEILDSVAADAGRISSSCLVDGVIRVTGLLSATKYRITAYIQRSGRNREGISVVLFTAPPQPPVPPTPVVSKVSDTSFKVHPRSTLRKRSTSTVLRCLVIVEELALNRSVFQSAIENKSVFVSDRRALNGFADVVIDASTAVTRNLPFYVAGIAKDSDGFVVGDGQVYHGEAMYRNVPLRQNSSYLVWFAWENSLDGISRRSLSAPAGPVVTGAQPDNSGSSLRVILIVLVVLCVLLIVFLFLSVLALLWKRWKRIRMLQMMVIEASYHDGDVSFVDRNLAVSYLSSLLRKSVEKDFDSISGTDGDYTIPEACLVYECKPGSCRSCPIPVLQLRDFCSDHLFPSSARALREQFEMLPDCFTDSVTVAMLPCNVGHNRSTQVIPYDRNRVKLQQSPPQCSVYMNASFVRTLGRRHCIVTQCPTLSTMQHFWQMVWERGISTIVMLMDSEAPDSLNFDCYWPEHLHRDFVCGSIRVRLVSVDAYADYVVRHFKIGEQNALRERHVFHWQYVSWLKGGVPEHPIPFLGFVKRIREERKSDSGFLVQCRTGGGRSGVYVAIDALLTQGHNAGMVDVLKMVTLLHTERSNMVKSFCQYRFIYETLCEEFDHNPTRFLAEKFVVTFEGLNSSESAVTSLNSEQEAMTQVPVFGSIKMRYLVPARDTLCMAGLTETSDVGAELDDLDPIPDQVLSGFVKRNMFIASRCPSRGCEDEFWHSVLDNRVTCIVMLNRMVDLRDAQHLLPEMGQCVNSKQFSVRCTSAKTQADNLYVAYNLKVWLRHLGDECRAQNVRLFEFSKWSSGRKIPEVSATIELLEQVRQWLRKHCVKSPVLLFSSAGRYRSRAAMLVVLWYVIEQSEMEGILDVFSTFRLIRSFLGNVLDDQDEYRFVHLATRDYLKRNMGHYTLPIEGDHQGFRRSGPGRTSSHRHSLSSCHLMTKRQQSPQRYLPHETGTGSFRSPKELPQKDPVCCNLLETDFAESEKKEESVVKRTSVGDVTSGFVEPPAEASPPKSPHGNVTWFESRNVSPEETNQGGAVARTFQPQGHYSDPAAKKDSVNPMLSHETSENKEQEDPARTDAEYPRIDDGTASADRKEAEYEPRAGKNRFAEYATVRKKRRGPHLRVASMQTGGNDVESFHERITKRRGGNARLEPV